MSKSQALEILREIQTATLKNAAPLPLKENAQPEWQGLGFQIGGLRLVTAMGEIAEILNLRAARASSEFGLPVPARAPRLSRLLR